MTYTVTFSQYHTYNVEAENENEAFNSAHEEFLRDMYYPATNTWYDEVCVDCEEEEDED